MILEKIAQWGDLLDLAALTIFCMVLLFLVWNRIRYRKWIMGIPATAADPCFGTELTAELIRQRARKTCDVVSRTLEQELDLFVDGLSGGTRSPGALVSTLGRTAVRKDSATVSEPHGRYGAKDSNYHFAFKMAAEGASAESIRSHAGLTEGEAELIFDLQRFQSEN